MRLEYAHVPSSTSAPPRRGFRGDVEALRGVAVAAVVLYHFFPSLLPSGFVGVDCFFAISGAVITLSMAREAEEEGRVSLLSFFARRFRRLTPTAVAATWATLLAAVALGRSVRRTGGDALHASLFSANVRFFREAGDYFAAQAEPSPMLHFWSLSVEEQFYFAYGPTVALLTSLPFSPTVRRRMWVASVAGAFAASLAAAAAASWHGAEKAAFFLTPFRVWEMAAGCLAALAPPPRAAWQGAALFVLGLSLALTPSSAPFFPGVAALPAVLSTCAVVAAGEVEWLSASRPLRFLGRISYSLYLWHWPVLCLLPISPLQGLIVSGCLSVATGVYLEPWGKSMSRKGAVAVLALFLALLPVSYALWRAPEGGAWQGGGGGAGGGGVEEVRAAVAASLAVDRFPSISPPYAYLSRDAETHPSGIIRITEGGRGEMLLAGDSHASRNVFFGVKHFAEERNITMFLSYRSSCPFPATGYGRHGYVPPDADGCRAYREADMAFIRERRLRWVVAANSEAGKAEEVVEALAEVGKMVEGRAEFVAFQDNPRTTRHDRELMTGTQVIFAPRPSLASPPAFFIPTRDLYCVAERCPLIVDGMVTTADGNHLTRTYARFIRRALAEKLAAAIVE